MRGQGLDVVRHEALQELDGVAAGNAHCAAVRQLGNLGRIPLVAAIVSRVRRR
jgi:hypothetical protein